MARPKFRNPMIGLRGKASLSHVLSRRRIVLSPAQAVELVARRGKPVLLSYQGELVAVVPARDFRLMERIIEQKEDRIDARKAAKRLSDLTEAPIPYADVRRRLGLTDLVIRDENTARYSRR